MIRDSSNKKRPTRLGRFTMISTLFVSLLIIGRSPVPFLESLFARVWWSGSFLLALVFSPLDHQEGGLSECSVRSTNRRMSKPLILRCTAVADEVEPEIIVIMPLRLYRRGKETM
jgi:hypothetical protein